ncbi:hypothetical protein SteCoe_16782 [Stentor coeruleus]|uniref:Importin subunit alpha n=1 Tax=Stentor coeruleus TaxID=5963 RepID=A0A1R2C0N2_9CILI|nr:hypothetical protein SteCoe_16782 [Stentor coeruleus]
MFDSKLKQKYDQIFSHNWEERKGKFAVELRKHKRYESIKKKRMQRTQVPENSGKNDNDAEILQYISNFNIEDLTYHDYCFIIPKLITTMLDSSEEVIKAISLLFCSITSKNEEIIDLFISCDFITYAVDLFTFYSQEVTENLLWALGNIAATGYKYRVCILETKFLDILRELLLKTEVKIDLIKHASRCLRILIEKDVELKDFQVVELYEIVKELLMLDFTKVNMNCLYVLDSLSHNGYIKGIMDVEILKRILFFLGSNDDRLKISACIVIGNIIYQSETGTNLLLDVGILDIIDHNIESLNPSIRKESCWILQNILAGSESQVKAVLNHYLIPKFIASIGDINFGVRLEASYGMKNLSLQNKNLSLSNLVLKFLEYNVLNHIVTSLQIKDKKTISNLVYFIENLLKCANEVNINLVSLFISTGLQKSLELCYLVADQATCYKISSILDYYFNDEEVLSDYEFNDDFVI